MGYSPWDSSNNVDVLPLLDNTSIIEQPVDLSKLSVKYAQQAISFISNATQQGICIYFLSIFYLFFVFIYFIEKNVGSFLAFVQGY